MLSGMIARGYRQDLPRLVERVPTGVWTSLSCGEAEHRPEETLRRHRHQPGCGMRTPVEEGRLKAALLHGSGVPLLTPRRPVALVVMPQLVLDMIEEFDAGALEGRPGDRGSPNASC
jgi:hypothetical protein